MNCNVHSIELIELLENLKGYYRPTVCIYLRSGDNLVGTVTITAESSALDVRNRRHSQLYRPLFGPRSCNSNKKKVNEQVERDRIKAKKITAAANKVRKAQEKADRAIQAAKRRRLAAEKKIQHAIDVQARKEL